MIRVMVVDDSAFMRKALSSMLESDPGIKVVDTAKNGAEAVEKVASVCPDIVTMDIEMPVMDGLEALNHIMAKTPVPVVMVSSLTVEGAKVTLQALGLGAVDFIPKNISELSINIMNVKNVLIEKIKQIGGRRLVRPALVKNRVTHMPALPMVPGGVDIVAIGTSTGGPKTLQQIIPALPKDLPVPVLIAQHMPANFTGPFAERLNQLSLITVKEAEDGEPVRPGVAYVAPGGGHMKVAKRAVTSIISITDATHQNFIYKPSVDALMSSVALLYSRKALGIILTGMGNDGLQGLAELKKAGGRVIAQNEETCVIYGMPKAVVTAGIADKILPAEDIPGEIINSVRGG